MKLTFAAFTFALAVAAAACGAPPPPKETEVTKLSNGCPAGEIPVETKSGGNVICVTEHTDIP